MGRSPCREEISGLKKGPWTPEEDEKLMHHIQRHGHGSWRALPKLAGLNRCGKSCRLRWTNYLRPDIKRGKFSQEEEQLIINLHSVLGNKYVLSSIISFYIYLSFFFREFFVPCIRFYEIVLFLVSSVVSSHILLSTQFLFS